MLWPPRSSFLSSQRPLPLMLSRPLGDLDPYHLYCRLQQPGRPSFLLESGQAPRGTARYSFLGGDPYLTLSGKGNHYEMRSPDRTSTHEGSPFGALTSLLRASRIDRPDGVPPFFGGAVGVLSYDLARGFESIPTLALDDLLAPDLLVAFFDVVAAIDHLTRTLHLAFTPPLHRWLGESRDKLYREGCDRLGELEARLAARSQPRDRELHLARFSMTPEQTREAYIERVQQCQELIRSGDIYQANLSHRFRIEPTQSTERESLWTTSSGATMLYQKLRLVNPSPFSALLTFPELSVVSSSPERLVRLQGRRVDTRPIAGTRPRGRDADEDRRLIEDLLSNAKERAEHLMLVDLERNDLGRVCRYGTVRVDEFMVVEQYSHVSHIVSNVTGVLREGLDGLDLIRAVFPGGTITGVPKIRCMEIIEQLEPVRRGLYTGAAGYLSWSGDLDLNILIRTIVLMGGRAHLQVGAGIVADSDPCREYDETLYKAGAVMAALGRLE